MIVLDTNVLSELMRGQPSPTVLAWVRERSGRRLATTSITVAEVRYGIERLPDGRRKELLQSAAIGVFAAFAAQVLPFDAAAAERYALIVRARERSGRPIDGFDAQIASICAVRAASLATRNGRDFEGVGLHVVDPFDEV